MRAIPYSTFRRDMKTEFQRCRDSAESVLVTNKDASENVVVMNARDYDALMETIRIYENPRLHAKILAGIADIQEGRGVERELFDA